MKPKPSPPIRPVLIYILVISLLGLFFFSTWVYRTWLRADVLIYVDNTSDKPMRMVVDGLWTTKIPPHERRKAYFRHGARYFEITQNGKTLLQGDAPLKAPKSKSENAMMKYILNPDRGGRYWQKSIEYGQPFMSSLLNLPVTSSEGALRRIAGEIDTLDPKGPWYNIEFADYAFEEPIPREVPGIGWATRDTVESMSREDYLAITGAKDQADVGEEEIQAMIARVQRLLQQAEAQ